MRLNWAQRREGEGGNVSFLCFMRVFVNDIYSLSKAIFLSEAVSTICIVFVSELQDEMKGD